MSDTMNKALKNLNIKVVGVGGTGINAIKHLKSFYPSPATYWMMDTDLQALGTAQCEETFLIGKTITRGMSAGGECKIAQEAIESDVKALNAFFQGTDMVFIIAGLAGGTGSGAAPIIAQAAAYTDAMVIAFVAMPFYLEGGRRREQAERALGELRSTCHAVIVIPNDVLLQQVDENASALEAFNLANEWIGRSILGLTTVLYQPGYINLDFASLKNVFFDKGGKAFYSLGTGEGEDYISEALNNLMLCPLMHLPEQARSADTVLVNIVAGSDFSISGINQVLSFINERFGNKMKTFMGVVLDPHKKQSVDIMLLGVSEYSQKITPNTYARDNCDRYDQVNIQETSILRKFNLEGQEEFPFVSHGQVRGYFDKTDKNHFDGEDLDVPTYLRRGIKIKI